jgi:hypothetical protein
MPESHEHIEDVDEVEGRPTLTSDSPVPQTPGAAEARVGGAFDDESSDLLRKPETTDDGEPIEQEETAEDLESDVDEAMPNFSDKP